MLKRFLSPLLALLLTALLLAGCGTQAGAPLDGDAPPEDMDPDVTELKTGLGPMATYLDLDNLSQETLDGCYETLDLTQEAEGATLHVTETMGDGTLIYIAFTLTWPEAAETLPSIEASLLQGSSDGSEDAQERVAGRTLRVEEAGNDVFNCLAIFDYGKEVLSAGEPLTLLLRNSEEESMNLHISVNWTPNTLGPVRYVDLKDDTGTMVGTALVSSLCLNITLWNTDGLTLEELGQSIALLDESGSELPVNTSFNMGGSTSTAVGGGTFYAPVDLEKVHAIQVGPYTTEVPQ